MKLSEIIKLLNAEVHHMLDDRLDTEISSALSSDLMSDVLAGVHVPDILITGLNNAQVIRTSSVFGIKAVLIVRGKSIDSKLIELSREEEIVFLSTKESMFNTSGILYQKGIRCIISPT